MRLGSSLYHARKKSGLTQENVAEKLGVSRQTISKWETDETLPDIRQSKGLAMLYHMTLDELIEYDFDEQQAQQMIDSVSDEAQARIDWNKVWSKKYPVLGTYHQTVRIDDYAAPLRELLTQLQVDYGYNHTDAAQRGQSRRHRKDRFDAGRPAPRKIHCRNVLGKPGLFQHRSQYAGIYRHLPGKARFRDGQRDGDAVHRHLLV